MNMHREINFWLQQHSSNRICSRVPVATSDPYRLVCRKMFQHSDNLDHCRSILHGANDLCSGDSFQIFGLNNTQPDRRTAGRRRTVNSSELPIQTVVSFRPRTWRQTAKAVASYTTSTRCPATPVRLFPTPFRPDFSAMVRRSML